MSGTRVLVLAGTAEARALAGLLAAMPGLSVIASLAGATSAPIAYPVPVASGGFGGAGGLAGWLAREEIRALVDATHPFATTMRRHAIEAARMAGVPLLRLERPGWTAGAGDRWHRFAGLDALLDALPAGACVFATLGTRAAPCLARRPDVSFLLRAVEPPRGAPPNVRVILGHPGTDAAAERARMEAGAITHLATRDAGGGAAAAKLAAARALGLPVYMVARPPPPDRSAYDAPPVATPAEAARWIAARQSRDRPGAAASSHPRANPDPA
ncbi:MAG: precorrin-6A/cobalt-precorrin-6A reductase [Pseudomonadota bacterium]